MSPHLWIVGTAVALTPLVPLAANAADAVEPRPAAEPATVQRGRGAERAQRDTGGRAQAPARRGAREPATQGDGPQGVDLARRYFHLCDIDGDGVMSYYEARASLELSRAEFAVYDKNVDGLCDEDEFRDRYETLIAKGGAFQPPRVAEGQEESRTRARAVDLIDEFDLDNDTLIGVDEVDEVLLAHSIEGVDIELLMNVVDIDGSGRLDPGEVSRLLPLLSHEIDPGVFARAPARSIEELFGTPEERAGGPDWAPEPPLIRGPIPSFFRLDLDRDGLITEQDLKDLLRPLKLSVRLSTVVASLDVDGDGGLGREELRRSMVRPSIGR